jgi:aryl-alcohol dehydrogenase-like predicted oxidoreductase
MAAKDAQALDHHRLPDSLEIGTGTWQWGDTLMWGFGKNYTDSDVREAFNASLNAGITFYDTAEMYGRGKSERLLGQFIRESGAQVLVATKFMPLPWRLSKGQFMSALRGSLDRLGMSRVDLYQIHWPSPPISVETWVSALADALDQGLTRAVGVSNYNGEQTDRAYDVLAKRGYPLASNQVEYSLIQRSIERDGTLKAAREHGVRIIAYSPLGKGLLTGKYSVANPPPGVRSIQMRAILPKLPPLIDLLRSIGENHGKSPAQVALNWTICKDTLPIPGAKNARQVENNAGAVGWRLTDDEIMQLDQLSEDIQL